MIKRKMMKNILFLAAFASGLFLSGCTEELIYINPASGPTDPVDPGITTRNVLVEELTGVRCPNCPEGTATLVDLGQTLGEKLIVVSVHAAIGYDSPYPESKYDFRTADGTEMANFIGSPIGFPSASVNRRIVPPDADPFLPRTKWAGIIEEDLAEAPQIGIQLKTAFNAATRKLDVTADLLPLVDLNGEHRLTVLITEDSIVDYQKVDLVKVSDYIHRHVLRDALSQATGDVISEPLVVDATIKKTFSITLPAAWKAEHCSVVAFVHHGTTPDKEVLQVVETHVIK